MSVEYERREKLCFRTVMLPIYETYSPALYHKCSRIRKIHLICQYMQHQYNKDVLEHLVQIFSTSHRLTPFLQSQHPASTPMRHRLTFGGPVQYLIPNRKSFHAQIQITTSRAIPLTRAVRVQVVAAPRLVPSTRCS